MKSSLVAIPLLLLAIAPTAAAESASETKKACVLASTEGQVARDDGKLMEARKRLLFCAKDECPAVVRKSCAQWLADVEERAPSAIIRVLDSSGADLTDASVSVDGEHIALDGRSISLEPGQHTAELVEADGSKSVHKFLLAEREKSRVIDIHSAPPRGNASSGALPTDTSNAAHDGFSPPTGAWVLGGVGVVALGSFVYFGLTAKHDLNQLQGECSPSCSDSQTHPGRTAATVADVSLGVGVAALAGAVTWALLAPHASEKAASARVDIVPTSSGGVALFRGSF